MVLPGRAHQLVTQCQTLGPENTPASNIWTEHVTFQDIYVHTNTNMHTIIGDEKFHEFEEQGGVNGIV